MSQKPIMLHQSKVLSFLQKLCGFENIYPFYDVKKHQWEFLNNESEKLAIVNLPLLWPSASTSCKDYIDTSFQPYSNYSIIMAQAGQACLGYVENNQLIKHKVIRKYMVRKKQGKSQLSYLKTKGKSRAGSRIRLDNSEAFFEEIHQVFKDWQIDIKSEVILYNMPPAIWGYLFNIPDILTIKKEDNRWRKVGFNFEKPGFEDLKKVIKQTQWVQLHVFDAALLNHLPQA